MLAHYFISFFFYFTSISPFAEGSFFEAYFSNFIEGTEFEVAEESDIIFRGRLFPERPEDAHDILETYQAVSSIDEMSKSYANFDEFISLLKARHLKFMSS